jgi:outer membrane immunogenic protein
MKKFLLGTVGLMALSLSVPANAADLGHPYVKAPPPVVAPIYDWSGFYVGLNGGGGSARKCWDLVQLGLVAVVPNVPEGCHDATGGTFGGQIGYRWQAASWVFGLEAQGNWANFRGNNINLLDGVPPFFFLGGLADESKVQGFGLFTGQVGYAWNNFLLYGKGGAAVTGDRYRTFAPLIIGDIDRSSETRWGAVLGIGGEFGFAPNWSVGIEWDHMFMGSRNVTAITPLGVISAVDHVRQDVDVGLVRINYRWGGPVVAKY